MPASDEQIRGFLSRQRSLIQGEQDAEVEQTSLLLSSCSPKLLELKGLALGGLGVVGVNVGLGGKSLVELERPSAYHSSIFFPPHTFRPGDLARIEENISNSTKATKGSSKKGTTTPAASKCAEGVVYKITDSRVVIAVATNADSEELDIPERCRLVKLANTVTYDRMQRTIDTLEKTVLPTTVSSTPDAASTAATTRPAPAAVLTPLIQVLLCMSKPSSPIPLNKLQFLDASLNESQKEAVRFALEAPEVALIHGPPGTGKTHTLVEIIRQLIAQDKRLLVCGASNLAVDNLLERLVPHGIPLTRIGHPARVLSSLLGATLDAQAARSDQSALAKDVKVELESAMTALAGKGKGRLKGPERRKMWDEVKELRKEYRKREGSVVKGVLSQAKIVLATCHSAGGRQLFNTQFDVIIIDEATQAMEAVCWVPILKAKKLILAGDPLQLPPTIISMNQKSKKSGPDAAKVKGKPDGGATQKNVEKSSSRSTGKDSSKDSKTISPPMPAADHVGADDLQAEDTGGKPVQNSSVKKNTGKKSLAEPKLVPPSTLETTLFDRLEQMYGPGIKRMLTVQYRMHEQIASFPSKKLYSSSLESHASVASHLLRDLPGVSSDPEHADVTEHPVVFFDTSGCEYFERLEGEANRSDEGSRCNENEAMVVKMWTEKLVGAGVLPSQIAIITPYQAQVTLIASLLRASMPELEIGTVDGMQGREKEAVILSLVRSNDQREVGFLKEKRRLNVAMTRPRRHLCIIGDSETVSQGSTYLKEWMEWLEENADVRYAGMD